MAALAVESLIAGSRAVRAAGCIALALSAAFTSSPGLAQTLYEYISPAGHWVFSDRPGEAAARVDWQRQQATTVRLATAPGDDGTDVLLAVNELAAWAQVAYRIDASRNLDPGAPRSGNFLLPPLSETRLTDLRPIDGGSETQLDISYQYLLGHPGARHQPDRPYRLPYSLTEAYRVSQAFPDTITHAAAANRHAVDFEMPVGTRIVAARAGVVIEVAGDFVGAGTDSDQLQDQANFVRVLHDDGTLALYGHLHPQSLRVQAGQRVARGQHIAASGNTGFSSGPHLHFVVQLNRAGAMESVPVEFAGVADSSVSLVTGDRPVAH